MGSSPLTRGKPVQAPGNCRLAGLIPAHAGKTIPTNRRQYLSGAHPRSRGENPGAYAPVGAVPGSSPLTRGKHSHTSERDIEEGLIPAHAGKTPSITRRSRPRPAHPRSRGENVDVTVEDASHEGSSPLTRGKRVRGRRTRMDTGLIPAHAGKTGPSRTSGWRSGAHPRSRGENGNKVATAKQPHGSSPLTRGKPGVPR